MRGCISDFDTNRFLCDKEEVVCKKCNTSGCNNGAIKSVESSKENESTTSDIENENDNEDGQNFGNKLTSSFILIALFLVKYF